MQIILQAILTVLGNSLAQQLIVLGLETAAKRSSNTVDDRVVEIVKAGFANKINPIARVVGK